MRGCCDASLKEVPERLPDQHWVCDDNCEQYLLVNGGMWVLEDGIKTMMVDDR
jgi:hypothetical protein